MHVRQCCRLAFTVDQCARCVDNITDVHSRVLIENSPEQTREVEEEGLNKKNDRNPLIIVDHLLWRFFWDVFVEGEVVGV